MSKKITVSLADDVWEKLRVKQSVEIKKSEKHVSFSRIVNNTLRKINF